MHGDVRFSQDSDATNPAIRREVVQVYVQECGVAFIDACSHCCFHPLEAIEAFGAPEIDDEMCSSENFAVFTNEVIE